MKPDGPLRRVPLERRTSLEQKTELQRSGPLVRRTPLRAKPARPARLMIELDDVENIGLDLLVGREIARPLARGRLGGWCELRSPWCQRIGREFSHRRAEGQGGLWVAENGLWSCGHGNLDGCHGWLHQNPDAAKEFGWIVPWPKDPANVSALIHTANYGHARVFLDRRGGVKPAEAGEAA
jgi:hypothetical protein